MCFYPPYVKPVVVEELLITGSVLLSSLTHVGDRLKLFSWVTELTQLFFLFSFFLGRGGVKMP